MVRASSLMKICLVIGAIMMTAYTIYDYFGGKQETPINTETQDKTSEVSNILNKERLDQLELEKSEKEHGPNLPILNVTNKVCEMKKKCDRRDIAFQVVSGAANVIGPSICVNGVWLLSNSKGNVDRGMNVAVVDGKTGVMTKTMIFDLYGTESQQFKKFLMDLENDEIIFLTTYDDATKKLKEDARTELTNLGSNEATKIAFRDNWIFVSGKTLPKHSRFEKHNPSQRDTNKFGDWPSTIMLEGCIPRL